MLFEKMTSSANSNFILADISSLSDPSSLVLGDGNTFLNILIPIIISGAIFLAKKQPQNKIIILIGAIAFMLFLSISTMLSSEETDVSKKEKTKNMNMEKIEREEENAFFHDFAY